MLRILSALKLSACTGFQPRPRILENILYRGHRKVLIDLKPESKTLNDRLTTLRGYL
jgi:hypothetical protein